MFVPTDPSGFTVHRQRENRRGAMRRRQRRRRGTATAELAVMLPIIFLIVFGSIEASNLIYLKQALTEAAYEGALEGMKSGATQTDVLQRVQMVLDARNIQGTTIAAGSGADPVEDVDPGEWITITVTAQTSDNLISPKLFATFSQIKAEVQARKQ